MAALFLMTPGTQATLHSELLQISIPIEENGVRKKRDHAVHIREIEHVVTTSGAHLSSPLLFELMKRNIPVFFTSAGKRVVGTCISAAPHSRARLAQYQKTCAPSFALAIAQACVEAKILNQRRLLQRAAQNRPGCDVTPALSKLDALAQRSTTATSLETLRGYEGAAADRYFETYNTFFPEHAPFEFRSRRPPHNAVNAVLSYAYSILAAEMECQLHIAGLDPALGLYHETQDRRPSLVLDLIEPFRTPAADALALDMFSHHTLMPDQHFERREGGVYLNIEGKKIFFAGWEKRLTREFRSPLTGARTTLRGELQRTAISLKQAILDQAPFKPFKLI